jgi:FAD/FMN-containing dehydrogenase
LTRDGPAVEPLGGARATRSCAPLAILGSEVPLVSSTDRLDALRGRVRGRVIGPADPDFDSRRRTFNAMLDRRPAVIVRPVDVADVSMAVAWAGENDLPISVRGGGHSVAGHGVGHDSLMVDLGEMRSVTVDPVARTADAGGGALLEDLDRATTAVGLVAPTGTYLDTGVAGLTLTGGIGYLLGYAGFACDALVGAELVAADGRVIQVDPTREPELLWALRGGGGNFGVVTRLRHALMPLEHVYGGEMRFEGAAVPEALRLLFELQSKGAPDAFTILGTIGRNEDGGAVAGIEGAWVGDPAEGPGLFAPFRELTGLVSDKVGPMSYLALQAMFERMGPEYRHYWKSQFVDRVTPQLEETILAEAAKAPAASLVLVEPIHGRAHRIPVSHAAFGGRTAVANVSALAIWTDPADDARAMDWARTTTTAMEPFSLRGGGYLNYAPEDESSKRIGQAFGRESYARLQALKRRVDPENRFRFNANIPPT